MKKLSALSISIINKTAALTILGLFSSTAAATQSDVSNESAKTTAQPVEKSDEKEKITDRRHPDYVKCRTKSVIGSLAKKRKVCMTNKQWAEANKSGNRLANDIIGPIQSMSGGGNFTDGK